MVGYGSARGWTDLGVSVLSRRKHETGDVRIIAAMQLELFPFEVLAESDRRAIYNLIRNSYWHLRNLRGGRFGDARRLKEYRRVEGQKKRLLLAGVSKREILDLLACCRLQCARHKQPFQPCKYCPG